MTDLHTHILPYIDDGAENETESLSMLLRQQQQGIRNIALTSHFDCETVTVDEFLAQRAAAFDIIGQLLPPSLGGLNLKLGCEVRYSPNLQNIDCSRLCLEGTDLLLLELPSTHYPPFLDQTLYELRSDGIIPLIAHVERYPYVQKDPSVLYNWASDGAYIQVNAKTLLSSKQKKQMLKLIRWGLVHVICSDTHSTGFRPPNLGAAMEVVRRELGDDAADLLTRTAEDLFRGEEPETIELHKPRNFFGSWL